MRKLHGYLNSRVCKSRSRKERPCHRAAGLLEVCHEFRVAFEGSGQRRFLGEEQVAQKGVLLMPEIADVPVASPS